MLTTHILDWRIIEQMTEVRIVRKYANVHLYENALPDVRVDCFNLEIETRLFVCVSTIYWCVAPENLPTEV